MVSVKHCVEMCGHFSIFEENIFDFNESIYCRKGWEVGTVGGAGPENEATHHHDQQWIDPQACYAGRYGLGQCSKDKHFVYNFTNLKTFF